MRPPSYYTSIANSNSSGRPSSASQSQLRSSISSPGSSSYASRTHLPFVAQSTLVAHCFTGVGSSTKPYINTYSSSSSSGASSGSSKGHFARSYTSSSYSNHSRHPSAYSSSSASSASISRASSGLYSPADSYSTSSTSSSSTSDSRHLSSSYAPLPRPSYLSPYSSSVSAYTRTPYRPTTTAASSSSYYKPIRLRERPILRQISRQLKSTPTTTTTTDEHHSSIGSSRGGAYIDNKQQEKQTGERTSETSREHLADGKEENSTKENEVDWSSDVARNISRNKYLIKFKEFDRQQRPELAQIEPEAIDEKPPITQDTLETSEPIATDIETTTSKQTEEVKPKDEEDKKKMKLEANETDAALDCDNNKKTGEIKAKPAVRKKKATPKSTPLVDNKETPKEQQTSAVDAVEAEKTKKITGTGSGSDTDKKTPAKRRNVKLKLRPIAVKNATDEQASKEKKQTKVADDQQLQANDTNLNGRQTKAKGPINESPTSSEGKSEMRQTKEKIIETRTNDENKKPTQVKIEAKKTLSSNGTSSSKRIRYRQYNYDDFNFLSVLGHGGWGFVVLAELKQHDACFAVKCIKKITIVEDDDFESILIERKVLTLGNMHPFICKLFCTFETEGYLFFVMEYCPGGDLMFHVQREGKFAESRCRFYAAEIICAIRFLHNRHIIYRDLKLDNILLDAAGHVRLVDFGMCQCRTYREEMLPSNFCGTPEYISPEIIKGVPYNHSVDWWSFGVLLYEMAVGKMPFRGNDENELLWNVCYEQIHYPMFLSKELTQLLQLLLEREPSKRMGMATCKSGDICEQPFFRSVDWKAVEQLRVRPPFVPEVTSKRDVQNFDSDFTESACELSPVDDSTLARIDQSQFQQFPYTNPSTELFDSN